MILGGLGTNFHDFFAALEIVLKLDEFSCDSGVVPDPESRSG